MKSTYPRELSESVVSASSEASKSSSIPVIDLTGGFAISSKLTGFMHLRKRRIIEKN